MDDLVQKYKPIIIFHPNEKYFPSSMEYMIQNASLYNKGELVSKIGKITIEQMETNAGTNLKIDSNHYSGQLTKENMDGIPIYVKVKENDKYYEITYIVYFMYNYGYNICGKLVGDHDSDLEHISVLINKESLDMIAIYYSYHSEGLWVYKKNVPMKNGHPIVWCAKDSHAFYPYSKPHFRVFCFANDYMGKGIEWEPKLVIDVDSEKPAWMKYLGQLSMNGIDNIPLKSWYRNFEEKISSNMCRDLCLPCVYNKYVTKTHNDL
jgi:hypothetical protein